jgi:hypothetical protein
MKYKIKAGVGKSQIMIPSDFFPYRSLNEQYYTGIHDELFVRCIMIECKKEYALILSMELFDIGNIEEWQKKIGDIAQIEKERIFLTVTHTHEAPPIGTSYHQRITEPEKMENFMASVLNAVERAVESARKSMRPAAIGLGSGRCDINVNRDFPYQSRYIMASNYHGISDKTVVVLTFSDMNDNIFGYLINYPVHGCVMFDAKIKDGGMLISGDLPGATSRIVEENTGNDAVAVWTSGAAADQNPRYLAKRPVFRGGEMYFVDEGEKGYLLLEVQAEELAMEILDVSRQISRKQICLEIDAVQRNYISPGQKNSEKVLGAGKDYQYEDGEPVNLHLSLLKLGDLVIVGIPGELVCSIGLQLKYVLLEHFENVLIMTHCNGSITYMSDEFGYENRTYEAVASQLKRGFAEILLTDGFLNMAEILLERQGKKKNERM